MPLPSISHRSRRHIKATGRIIRLRLRPCHPSSLRRQAALNSENDTRIAELRDSPLALSYLYCVHTCCAADHHKDTGVTWLLELLPLCTLGQLLVGGSCPPLQAVV
jgi:hypothetical protein